MNEVKFTKRKAIPSLFDIFDETLKAVLHKDLESDNSILELLEEENATFFIRVMNLFVMKASRHYTVNEITDWVYNNVLDEVDLPELESEE